MTANIFLSKVNYPGITSDYFRGTACTGADKSTGRELTVTDGANIVTVDRRTLTPEVDFTVTAGVITFNIPLDNRANIGVWR